MRSRIRNRRQIRVLLITLSILAVACSAEDSTDTTATVDTSPTTTGGVPTVQPEYEWNFNGDGAATVGDVPVELLGSYEVTDEAVSFDGYSGHAIASRQGLIDTTESFTVSAWANHMEGNNQTFLGLLGADSYAVALSMGQDNQWMFVTKAEDRTGIEHGVIVETPPVAHSTSWTHLVGVFDKVAGVIRFYVDGQVVGETAMVGPFKAEGPLTIGRGQFDGGPGNFWSGAVDSVAIYQSALTAEQITEQYQTTKPTFPPPPLPAPDPMTYGNGILNGTWDYTYNDEDAKVILNDFAGLVDSADEVTVRLAFDDHKWWIGFLFDKELFLLHGVPEGAGGTFTIEGDTLTTDEGFATGVFKWSLDGDELTMDWLSGCEMVGSELECSETGDPLGLLVVEHTFTRSGDDPSY